MPAPDESHLTDDAFLGGALRILQPARAYRAGLDAVLAAAAVPARPAEGARILDAGAGVGVLGLCVARRIPDATVTLVENEPTLAAIAQRNIERNALSDRVGITIADVAGGGIALSDPARATLAPDSFDHVAANPPYMVDGRGSRSPDARKATAHSMPALSLDAWLRFLAAAARNGGTATIIYRADALLSLLNAMAPRFGALRITPIHPRAGEPAHRVIVQGIKGSRAPMSITPGLVLHGDGNAFRHDIDAILRHGAALPLA